MANITVTLGPYNNVSLALGNNYHLVAPTKGHYYFSFLNAGTANIAISNANTVGLSDPNSFLLPPNGTFAPLVWGPDGLWVGAGAPELLSVALIPRQQ